MKRIDRYILSRWIALFIPTILVLIFGYLTTDIAFRVWSLLEKNISGSSILLYFFLRTPAIVFQMVPLASLLATLLTLTKLKQTGELGSLFCSGLSGLRIGIPVLAACLASSAISFYIDQNIAPAATRISEDIRRSGRGDGRHLVSRERIWLLEEGQIVHIGNVEEEGSLLLEPTVLVFSGPGMNDLVRRIDAPRARWQGSNWIMEDAIIRHFDGGLLRDEAVSQALLFAPIGIKPEEFLEVRRDPDEMNREELLRYIENLKRTGLPYRQYEVQLFTKSAAAAIPLIFGLFALTVGYQVPIRGGVPLGIGLSIFLSLIYWSFFSLALSLGNSGLLEPRASAWSVNIVFLVLGLGALATKRNPRLT